MTKVTVIGAGTWGMALALLLDKKGQQVTVWSALSEDRKALQETRLHKNLPGIIIPDSIEITGDLDCIRGAELVVLAVPSVYTRETARKMKPYVAENQIIVNVAKGIEESTLMTLSEQIE